MMQTGTIAPPLDRVAPPVAEARVAVQHLQFIDAVRGLAILGVILVHVAQRAHLVPGSYLRELAEQGARGVQLFYIASAFTLYLSMGKRSHVETAPLRNFCIRRFFRIAPLFYLGVLVFLLYDGSFGLLMQQPVATLLGRLFTTLTFTFGLVPNWIYGMLPGGWSITVEMGFYVLLPCIFRYITSFRKAMALFLLTIPLALGLRLIAKHLLAGYAVPGGTQIYPLDSLTTYFMFWLPTQLPIFILGVIFFFLYQRYTRKGEVTVPHRKPLATVLYLLTIAMTFAFPVIPLPAAKVYCFSFALFGFVCALWLYPLPIFVNRGTCYMGLISYSGYIFHMLPVTALGYFLPKGCAAMHWPMAGPIYLAVYVLAVLILIVPLATVTYRLLEVPGQQCGRRLIAWLDARRVERT